MAPSLRDLVEWRRVPAPRRTLRLRWASFFVGGSLRLLGHGFDLVHVSGGMPLVASRADIVWVHVCHAALHEAFDRAGVRRTSSDRLARSLSVGLERWTFGRSRLLVAPAEDIMDDLARRFPDVPAVVVPLAIDTERFRPDPAARAALRSSLGVGEDEVVAVFVGRDWRLKGLDVALEGVARAASLGSVPLRLWVLGDRPGANDAVAVRETADRLGLAGRVLLAGDRPDVERYYQGADVFVLPTLFEVMCRAAHEAAACELPIVATPVNGVRSLTGDGAAGIIVERDAGSIADALLALARDPDRRASLGRTGRSRVLHLTADRAAERMLALYRQVLDAR